MRMIIAMLFSLYMVFLADNTLTYVACKVYWLQQCVEAEFKIQKPICTLSSVAM